MKAISRLGRGRNVVLDGAVPGTVNLLIFEQELAIDHRRPAAVAAETRGIRVPVHLSVTNPRLFRPDGPATLVAILLKCNSHIN